MSEARVEVTIGAYKFLAEGSEKWVDQNYQTFLSRVDSLPNTASTDNATKTGGAAGQSSNEKPVGPLAIFLKDKKVGANQNNRFLATAMWLKLNGQAVLKTSDVIKALAQAQQQRLGNPADILNQNVSKGYCVKTGDGFYITPEGEDSFT